jgi:ATP-dependent Lon protease
MISEYTAEAGVRDLERQIAAVCRKVARRAAEGDSTVVRVTRGSLDRLLGAPRHPGEAVPAESQIGVANGLAWTEAAARC